MAAYFADNSTALLMLEQMIDKVGTRNVAYAVARICALKADHVAENWQDGNMSKSWEQTAAAWEKFAAKSPASPLD